MATKIVNGLAATEATAQTVDDVKSTNIKIQGRRAKAVEKPDAKALAAGAEPVKTASTSQQSYYKLIDHFAQLINIIYQLAQQLNFDTSFPNVMAASLIPSPRVR